MTKQEFLAQLRERLSGLPQADIDERIAFYSEMIDDRVEDGLPEEEAVSETGNIDDIVSQIVVETPLTKIVKEKLKSKRKMATWQTVLLVVGSPVWLPLLIAFFAVGFSLWISMWAVIVSLWSVVVSFAAGAVGAFIGGIIFIVKGYALSGIWALGAGVVCAGLFIFMLYACKAITKGAAVLTKKIVIGIKNMFIGKGEAE